MSGVVSSCECAAGVLVDQTYGYANIPTDAVPVQRCDLCTRFRSDEAAAVALAHPMGHHLGHRW